MSNNEIMRLDANFTKWKNTSGVGLQGVEPFLFYSVDNILKPYNLSFEDVRYGITDNPNDGGIDAFYILANRNTVVRDDIDLASSGTDRLRLVLFQSKSSDSETGFKADDIDKFARFADDLLDLGKDPAQFHYKYEGHLRTIMQTFKTKYLSIAGNFPTVEIDFYYVTKGDETKISQTDQDAIDRLDAAVKKHLGDSLPHLYPVNTQSLLKYAAMHRQKVRSLKWAEAQPLPIGDGYIGLVKLKDWYAFLRDETGELDDLIFESNVRGFRGNSAINRHIFDSLQSSSIPFWQLNNGVTIVSSNKLQPMDSMNLNIEDPQIVNGLQTSSSPWCNGPDFGMAVGVG
jgi:AIPR protein